MPTITLSQILDLLHIEMKHDNIEIKGFDTLSDAKKSDITFCKFSGSKGMDLVSNCNASVVLVPQKFTAENIDSNAIIVKTKKPRLDFMKVMAKFFPKAIKTGIHVTAIIGENVKIGNHVYIGPYAVIGDNCSIGDNSQIYSHVVLYDGIQIGNNSIIHANSVIGADGFGYEKDNKEIIKFPHHGSVVIGNNVEIGSNSNIDRGTIGDTIIKDDVKIDNQVHVGHNVVIEKGAFLIANSMIGGSVHIGEYSWIAPSASIINGIKIGENSLVGMGAVVNKKVKPNVIVTGFPAKIIRDLNPKEKK